MKHKLLFLLVSSLLSVGDMSAQYINKAVEIWPKELPGGGEKKPVSWKERPTDGNSFFEVTNPTLEAFLPDPAKSNGKAVVVCPGGSYMMLAYEKEGQEVAQWLSSLGYNAYVLAYRVPNNRLGALQDVQRAIRIVRSKGALQVGVIGFSAGASLSCRAATRWDSPAYEPNPKDKIDSLSCRPDFGILIYPAYLDEGENHTLTPELTVTSQTPPLFVFGTEDDVNYSGPSTPVILEAMQKAGAPIEVHYLTKGGHGYGMRRGAGLIWPSLAEQWLKELK
ncbi:MAG: alpha/beta hydrolase [Bacteroidaceae bacterium]|nr:alpha/beta hydrolase [Bacteroidaceae bacterium]